MKKAIYLVALAAVVGLTVACDPKEDDVKEEVGETNPETKGDEVIEVVEDSVSNTPDAANEAEPVANESEEGSESEVEAPQE